MSLKWRIAFGMAFIAGLVSAFGAVVAYLNTADRLTATIDDSLRGKAADLAPQRGGSDHPGDPDRSGADGQGTRFGCPPNELLTVVNAVQVVAAGGTVTRCIGVALPVDTAVIRRVQAGAGASLTTVKVGDTRYRVIATPRSTSVLLLARSLRENDDVLRALQLRLALFAGAGIIAAALLGWVLATRIVAPLERLRASAERIARTGELDGDVTTSGTGEIRSLTTSFATMVEALSESRRRQQQLVADASHELRTPLTSLQTNAELLERADRLTDAQRQQVSEGIRFEVRELTDLVSELVDLARDPANDDEDTGPLDLAVVAQGVVEAAGRRTNQPITLDVQDATPIVGRSKALTRAASNLVDNAIKHGGGASGAGASDSGAPIEISVHGTTFEVRDHGPGIPPADLPKIFDRFYRADVARTEPGSGLGLAIVAQVVEDHGGTVFARNHPDGGAVVGFRL